MSIFKLAFRNVLRNKRRSLITILAITLGFMAIDLFGGYMAAVFRTLKDAVVFGEGLGHLTIFKKGFLEEGKINPQRYLITAEEQMALQGLLKQNQSVHEIMPRLDVAGLVSNGTMSTIFTAQGVRPELHAKMIAGTGQALPQSQGRTISVDAPTGVLMGSDLAKMLDAKLDDTVVMMANTLAGQMNALDIQARGIFNTGMAATNDKFMVVPLNLAQSLYDTESVDRLTLLIDDISQAEKVRTWLLDKTPGIRFEPDVKTWEELSAFYTQVRSFYGMLFAFIFCIVLMIVVTSVVNTMTMSVVERTQEIGTLRALGMRQRLVIRLFAAEGAVIGMLGVGVGFVGTVAVTLVVSALGITYAPPGTATATPLEVDLVPSIWFLSGLFLVLLSVAAAVIPSVRASRLSIVDAFGHV
ncbi:MAG: ABC transporter permease [Candidatus Schekmanbacteria bacterium]|nr:ABC transporter permease [Candidatus Schekmanbacteria bacterium]